jgi:hypothetical protein
MVQFINMPGFQSSPLLDLSPLAQGLQMRQKAEQAKAAQAMQERQFAEQQRQFGATNQLAQNADQRAGEKAPFEQQKLQAEAERLRKGPAVEYGKQGSVFQGPDQKFYSVQFASNGERRIVPVATPDGTPLEPAKGVMQIGDELASKSTGLPVRNVAPQLENKEAAEKIGAARGQSVADLPRKLVQAEGVLKTVRQLREHEGAKGNFGLAGMVPNMPGGKAADANTLIEQIRGKAFLEAFNQLRGGGAITEAEGQKATVSLIRAQNAQSYPAFLEALADFEYQVQTGIELSKRQAGIGGPSGNVGVNPQTGGWSARKID